MIRREFRRSGLTIKALSEQAGIPYGALHGLLNGQRDCTLGTAAKLAAVLGLELKPTRSRRKHG